MAIFRCKMCGGDLEVIDGASSCTCEFCGTQQTIPTVKDEGLQTLFNRANVLRMKSEFDKAAEVYEKIVGGKVNLPPQGKEFFTRRGKQFFTSRGKHFFT